MLIFVFWFSGIFPSKRGVRGVTPSYEVRGVTPTDATPPAWAELGLLSDILKLDCRGQK